MKKVSQDCFVRLRYRPVLQEKGLPPWLERPVEMRFVYGRERIPSPIEEAILNRTAGEKIQISLKPEQAYGPHLPYLIKEIEISSLKDPEKLKVGEWYTEENAYGEPTFFKVLKIEEGKVLADFNHPCAGKEITLEIEILEVREASPTEILIAEFKSCQT